MVVSRNTAIRHTATGKHMPMAETFANNIKHIGALTGDKHTDGGSMYLLVTASGEYLRKTTDLKASVKPWHLASTRLFS